MLVQIVSLKHDLVIMNYYGEEVTHSEIPGTLMIWDIQQVNFYLNSRPHFPITAEPEVRYNI